MTQAQSLFAPVANSHEMAADLTSHLSPGTDPEEVIYGPAGGSKRALAYLLDLTVVAALVGAIWWLRPSPVLAVLTLTEACVVLTMVRARTGRSPGLLATSTAAIAYETQHAPGLRRQLVHTLLMGLLHLTVLGPLVIVIFSRRGQDWVDRIAGTAVVDLRNRVEVDEAELQGLATMAPFGEEPSAWPTSDAGSGYEMPSGSGHRYEGVDDPTSQRGIAGSAVGWDQAQELPQNGWGTAEEGTFMDVSGEWPSVPAPPAPTLPPGASAHPTQLQRPAQAPAEPLPPAPQPEFTTPHMPQPAQAPHQQPPQHSDPNPWPRPAPQGIPLISSWPQNDPGQPFSTSRPLPPPQGPQLPPPQGPQLPPPQGQPLPPPQGQPLPPPPGQVPPSQGRPLPPRPTPYQAPPFLLTPPPAAPPQQPAPAPSPPPAGSGQASPPLPTAPASAPRHQAPQSEGPVLPQQSHQFVSSSTSARRAAALSSGPAPSAPQPRLADEDPGNPRRAAASGPPQGDSSPTTWLVTDSGRREHITGVLVIGRGPAGLSVGERPVVVDGPTGSVSRNHLKVGQSPQGVWAEDMFSTNGTSIRTPDGSTFPLERGRRVAVPPGSTLIMGGERTVTIVSS